MNGDARIRHSRTTCRAVLLGLATAPAIAAQATLVEQEFTSVSVPHNAPLGDDYPFVVTDSGTIKSLGWGFTSTGWRDLHLRYTLPSGVFFDQVAGDPKVDVTHTLGEESAGVWTLNLLENLPGPAHTVSTGIGFVTQRHADPNLPVTGAAVPELAGLDVVMRDFLVDHGFEAATLAVVKDRAVVYERGFGWQDRDRTTPILPNAVLRIASVTIPITARATRELVEAGQLDQSAKAYDVLGIPPLPGHPIVDSRVLDVTIGQLLDHASGFADHAPTPHDLGALLGLGRNATLEETIAYMWSSTLLYEPGGDGPGSHYAYQMLGAVIEEASGLAYDEFVHTVVGVANGMPTLHEARDTPEGAYPDEIWYAGEWFQHHEEDFFFTGDLVEQPYAIDFSTRPGAGSVVASARDMATFVTLFFLNGAPKPADLAGVSWFYEAHGSLPGTTAVVRDTVSPDGSSLAWVALVNERLDAVPNLSALLADAVGNYLDGVTRWPTVDPWTDLAGGTSVGAFAPTLELDGPLTPSSSLTLDIFDAAPQVSGVLLISKASTSVPVLNGTLFAIPYSAWAVITTDPSGGVHESASFPGAIPGTPFWFQAVLLDPTLVPDGVCLTNGVLGVVP